MTKQSREVARAELPPGIIPDMPDGEGIPVEEALSLCEDLDDWEDALEADPTIEDEGFYSPIEMLAKHIGRLLRQVEGVELHELGDVFGHEWGWSIELRFHSITYSLQIGESAPMSGKWQLRVLCHAGWFDRWFNRRLVRFCDENLCEQVKAVMLEYSGIDAWEWQALHLPESIS